MIGIPRATLRIMKYELRDVTRSRWLLAYTLFFLIVTDALIRFGGSGKALVSLISIALFVIPLVALVFGTVYLDNARDFTELLLAQPVSRRQLFGGLYLGLTLPLGGAFVAGLLLPFGVHGLEQPSQRVSLAVLAVVGLTLTFVFTALAFVAASRSDDQLRRMGAAVGLWLLVAVVYDGLVLVLVMLFGDYPIERPMLGLMLANPVDLARVILLLQFDLSALLGYTGATFQQLFSGGRGVAIAAAALGFWVIVPLALGLRAFERRDF